MPPPQIALKKTTEKDQKIVGSNPTHLDHNTKICTKPEPTFFKDELEA